MRKPVIIFILLFCVMGMAQQEQNNADIAIDAVVLENVVVPKKQHITPITVLTDSIIEKSKKSLTELLQYNSTIYFKENGYGMVSSPSFRGTTAQQTSVLWNGIAINSRFLGQTDFNAVAISAVNSISIKPGGGSIVEGSGAIGGSIHLNNTLSFSSGLKNKLRLAYGSFNTLDMAYRLQSSSANLSSELIVTRNSSDNDFEVNSRSELSKNTNGQFYNQSVGANFAYKLDNYNTLSFFSQFYDDERHFSLTSPNETKTKYQNRNVKSLFEYKNIYKRLTSTAKFAFLNERYRYYNDIRNPIFLSEGNINTYISKYNAYFKANSKITLRTILDYEYNEAKGQGNGITEQYRGIFSSALLFNHQLTPIWNYELGLRKETSSIGKSPLLFSFTTTLDPLPFYNCTISISKNYRIPTFNDLFWENSGNPNLKTEQSLQFETTQNFTIKNTAISITGYYYTIKDMIRWVPTNKGIWVPINTDNVTVYGSELSIKNKYRLGKQQYLAINGNYAYTVSQDKRSKKQLFFVPYHKANANASYSKGRYSTFIQGVCIGKVFTTLDNNPNNVIKGYGLINAGITMALGKKEKITLGITSNNITNVIYENKSYRPMPMRNYATSLTIKI